MPVPPSSASQVSGLAVAAGYLGLLGLIPYFSPLALLFGFLALGYLSNHPERQGRVRAIFAIVVGVVGTIILIAMNMT
jgi:hypothetical protein